MNRKFLLVVSLLCVFCATIQAQTPIGPKPPFTAKDLELGKKLIARSLEIQNAPDRPVTRLQPHDPFKILGNLYFVGVGNGEVFLLTSPQGHILFGTGYPTTPQLIEKNVETLGFKMSDIKTILISYWHVDNAGGAAYFKQKTGAAIMTGVAEIPFIERGGNGTGRGAGGFQPVRVDRALFNGDVIKSGPLSVTAWDVPGHTPGGMAWTFTVREGNRDYKVFVQGPTFVEATPADIDENPGYSEAGVRHSFETFRKLLPVDVYLASPAFGFWMEDRLAKLKAGDKLAFVDRSLFPAIVAAREVEFEEAFQKAKHVN